MENRSVKARHAWRNNADGLISMCADDPGFKRVFIGEADIAGDDGTIFMDQLRTMRRPESGFMSKQRDDFEQWIRNEKQIDPIRETNDEQYMDFAVEMAWQGWIAARGIK